MTIQRNLYRDALPMSGMYQFTTDPQGIGEAERWFDGLPAARPIAVPGSWNEQYQDLDDFCGTAWYERREFVPEAWRGRRILLRVGAAAYLAKVWVNGTFAGEHEGGCLPFEFDVTGLLECGQENRFVFSVDAAQHPDRLPPGNFPPNEWLGPWQGQHPANNYDFYPYGGIHRPVHLLAVPAGRIVSVRVATQLESGRARVACAIAADTTAFDRIEILLDGETKAEITGGAETGEAAFELPDPVLWEPSRPHLYQLTARAIQGGQPADEYTVAIGLRTVAVEGGRLLLNGKPVFLRGFGKHEDFPMSGKGLNEPVMIKDYNLLNWIGANSYRTSHYPYSEEMLDLADRLGVLVIDESPLVGLMRRHYDAGTLERCKALLDEMIARDRNHPSVIMWSVANEPTSNEPAAGPFFKALYDHVRALDDSRPVTMATCYGTDDVAVGHFDVISLNKYYGWYSHPGQLEEGERQLAAELEAWRAKHGKPILITEFGADAVAGMHHDPPRQWTEEYQAEMLTRQYRLFASTPGIIGAHVWAFADFKTSQIYMRVLLNHKGVFTRERQPKLAAHALKKLWTEPVARTNETETP